MKMYSIFKRSFTKYTKTLKDSTWAILQDREQKKTTPGMQGPVATQQSTKQLQWA